MLLEIYAQSFDLTTIYSVYIPLLLSVTISAFWFLNSAASISESLPVKFRFQPTASEAAYNNKVEIGRNSHLVILKCIKIKIEPGDEGISNFSPKIKIDNKEEKNEKILPDNINNPVAFSVNRVPTE